MIYYVTNKFPKEETYGLINQIRRASIFIASNIAEGSGHSSNKEFRRFLEIAYSSSCELDTQLILSNDLNFLNENELIELNNRITEIQKMLHGLINSIKN